MLPNIDKHHQNAISIPNNIVAPFDMDAMIEFVYPHINAPYHYINNPIFQKAGIVAPTLKTTAEINQKALEKYVGREILLTSDDNIHNDDVNRERYSNEFLWSLDFKGFPSHIIKLKKGSPVMLIRTVDKSRNFNNGTKLTVETTRKYLLTLRRAAPPFDLLHLPRWRMETSAAQLGFTLTRKQFPIMPAFCTTINKIQGHTMNKIGIYLDRAIFAHGQLYVALSRAIGPHAVLLMIQETQTQGKNSNNDNYHTLNIVHRELFQY